MRLRELHATTQTYLCCSTGAVEAGKIPALPDLCEFWYAPWTNRLHRVDSDDSVSSRRYLEETQQCAMERVCRCMQNIAPLSMVQFVYTSLSSATSCPRGWLYARYASRHEQRIGMLIKGDHSEKYATVRQSKHLCVGSSLPCQTCAAFPSVFNAVSWLVRLQRRVLAGPEQTGRGVDAKNIF